MSRAVDHPRPVHRTRRIALVLAVCGFVLVGAACSSDDEAGSTTTSSASTTAPSAPEDGSAAGADPQFAELCELATEVNEQDGPPTAAQLEQYATLAPEDLRPAVERLAAAFTSAGDDLGAVFGNADNAAALDQITEFEATTCGLGTVQDPGVSEVDPDATRVDVVATDHHFEADFPTAAGRYSFVVTNDGAEPHMAILARLEDGVSVEDALASDGEEGVAESFESEVVPPGAEAVVTADLGPGNWVLLCPIPDAEGTPHVALGMVHDFTVA